MTASTASATSLPDEISRGYSRGWCYIPLRTDGNLKAPRLKGWTKMHGSNRASLDQVLAWAAGGRIGVLTGHPSGFVVLDVEAESDPAVIASLNLPPTVTARTGGGGWHYYYLVPEGIDLRNWVGKQDKESGRVRGIADHVDIRCDGGQVLSVGSIHPETGNPYAWAPGLSPDDVPIAPFPVHILPKQAPHGPEVQPSAPASRPDVRTSAYVQKALQLEFDRVRDAPDGSGNATVNEAAFNLGQLVGGGEIGDREVIATLQAATVAWTARDGNDSAMRRQIDITIRSGLEGGKRKPRNVPPAAPAPARTPSPSTSPQPSPEQKYTLIPGAHLTDEGEYVEVANGSFATEVLRHFPAGTIYRRGGMVGQLVGDAGSRKFAAVTLDRMRIIVDQHARLGRWMTNRSNGDVTMHYQNCKRDTGGLVMDAARGHDLVPELRILSPHPIYLRDGSIAAQGWNAGGIYYDPSPEIAKLTPDTDQESILTAIEELLIDFPWKTLSDQQNFVGLLLTPIVRFYIDGNTPMHLLMSPIERSGKSKLAETVFGIITLGHPIPAMQLSGHEEEIEKRITSLLMYGDIAVHFDNLAEFMDSPSLASLLTARIWRGRVLGSSTISEVVNDLIVIGSGNNVRATTEIVKRTIPIQLEPRTDCPEARTDFQHPDLERYLRDVRPRVLQALLGMVERWKSAGCPYGTIRLGGFDRWAEVIGGIMKVNGFIDWMTNARTWSKVADPHRSDLEAFVEAWYSAHSTMPVTVRELLTIAKENDLFTECFCSPSERGQLTSFSRRVLGRHLDSPVGAFHIRRRGSGNNSMYKLESN